MIKGLKAGLEAAEEHRPSYRRDTFIPNISKGYEKLPIRILSDVGQITTHNLWMPEGTPINLEDADHQAKTGRWWDFCVRPHGECPHCIEYFESGKKSKKISDKFVIPVLVRPYKYKAKETGEVKETKTKVSYIFVSERDMKTIDQMADEAREKVGDNPNDYLTYADLKIWKDGEKLTTVTYVLPTTRVDEIKDNPEDVKLICEFFGIEKYTPKLVEAAMVKEWEQEESDAVERLLTKKVVENTSDDIPNHLKPSREL